MLVTLRTKRDGGGVLITLIKLIKMDEINIAPGGKNTSSRVVKSQ